MSSKIRTFKRLLLTGVAAGALSLLPADVATAGCGCEASCGACAPVSQCECCCDCSKLNCIDKAMNKLKGGMMSVKNLFHFRHGKSACDGCDDACDAAMVEELMMAPTHHHPHATHHHPHATHVHPHAAPTHEAHPAKPHVHMDKTPMRDHAPAPMNSKLPEPVGSEEMNAVPPPPVRMPAPEAEAPEEGSLFDTLSDPFKDDDARVQSLRSVRPSNYVRPLRPAPLSRQSQSSSRRVSRTR